MAMDDKTKVVDVSGLGLNTKTASVKIPHPCLVQYTGIKLGKRYDLDQPELLIGRDASCHIMVDDESKTVSRRHAILSAVNGGYELRDEGSFNGTFVNGQRITRINLKDGDQIKLGSLIVFKFFSLASVEMVFHDKIYQMATIDALTQIFNKKYFLENMDVEINKAKSTKSTLCLIMFDIDHFKKKNDTYGHPAGDYILKEMCKAIKARLRDTDIFARYGGEEFAVILPDTDIKMAVIMAETIRKTVESHSFIFEGQSIPTTISLGVELLSANQTLEALISATDKRLYLSKSGGRNKVSYPSVAS